MTRACQCGGIVRQHQLTGEREAWTCNACRRYGAIPRGEVWTPEEIEAAKARAASYADWYLSSTIAAQPAI